MDVTSANFKSVLPVVEKAIEECTFLGIDCELTGLNTVRNIQAFDSVAEYYGKIRNHCKDFLVIQYGLSTFRYDTEENLFKQQSFNFYIFRSPINRNIPDQRFLCQASSINFLISQGFDFNKLFKEGISYLNQAELDVYKKSVEESFQKRINLLESRESGTFDTISIPEDAQDFIDKVKKEIDDFLETDEDELELPKCNAFLRRLIYQVGSACYAKEISLESRQINKDRIMFAKKVRSREELENIEKERHQKELEEMDDFEGFSKVMKMIVKSGKLVIGHNLSLDFLHTIDKFLTPLPDDYEEFKNLSHHLFNNILDTKYMASTKIFSSDITSHILKDLLDTVSIEPFGLPAVEIEEGAMGYHLSDAREHEAGYDAYITGLCLLGMWKYLGTLEVLSDEKTFGNLDLLQPFLNRIFVMNLADSQYINIAGADLNPSRDHVFYLTFPKEWKQNNIVQLFSPFGNVYISWINDCSAYVALYKKDQAAMALSTLSQSNTYTILPFAKRKAILSGLPMPLKSPVRGMKRKSTDGPPPARKNSLNSIIVTSKRSIDAIEEEKAESEETVATKKFKKTFSESDSWD